MMTPKQFRERRIALGLSVDAIAAALHVDTKEVLEWEHGDATGSRFEQAADRILRQAEIEQLKAISGDHS